MIISTLRRRKPQSSSSILTFLIDTINQNKHVHEFGQQQQQWRSVHHEVRKKLKEKKAATKIALDYFDFFYGASYGTEWNRARLALLTSNGGLSKQSALVNNYCAQGSSVVRELEREGTLDLVAFSRKLNSNDDRNDSDRIDVKSNGLKSELVANWPHRLKVYCHDSGDVSRLVEPTFDQDLELLNFYSMDASSILPVIALNIQKGDTVLDLCASPGDKTLAILQTMLPSQVTCRDVAPKRLKKIKRLLKAYVTTDEAELDKLVKLELNELKIEEEGEELEDELENEFEENLTVNGNVIEMEEQEEEDLFDRVLVSVPCVQDRLSLNVNDNSLFSVKRTDERLEQVKRQVLALTQAVQACKLDGTIVYATSTMSPNQNEGVVNSVLASFANSVDFELCLVIEQPESRNLSSCSTSLDHFFNFSSNCQQGLLVTPTVDKNFGPLYLCKIIKKKKKPD